MSSIEEIMQKAGTAAKHMVESHPNLYGHVKSGVLNLRHHASEIHHRHKITTPVSPSAEPFTSLTSGDSSDFDILKGEVLSRMTLELTLKTDALYTEALGETTIETVLDCIDNIQFICNGSSTAVYTVDSDDLRVAFSELSESKYLRAERAIRGAPAGGLITYLSASEERKCYINIARNVFVDNEMFISGFTQGFTVRVKWNGNSTLGKMGVTIGKARMILESYKYAHTIRKRLMDQYLTGPKLDFRYMKTSIQRAGAVSVTPNSTYKLLLTGVSGMVTNIVVIARIGSTPVYLSGVVLKDAEDLQVLGSVELSHSYTSDVVDSDVDKYYSDPHTANIASDAYYRLPIAENSVAMGTLGAVSGYIDMNSKHSLELVYKASDNVPVSILFTVLYSKVATLSVEQGVAIVEST